MSLCGRQGRVGKDIPTVGVQGPPHPLAVPVCRGDSDSVVGSCWGGKRGAVCRAERLVSEAPDFINLQTVPPYLMFKDS